MFHELLTTKGSKGARAPDPLHLEAPVYNLRANLRFGPNQTKRINKTFDFSYYEKDYCLFKNASLRWPNSASLCRQNSEKLFGPNPESATADHQNVLQFTTVKMFNFVTNDA